MTDNEIIKALECCIIAQCKDCCYRCEHVNRCTMSLKEDALDLINRQKEEIERLKEDNEIKSQKRANIFEITNAYERGRAEAVKEFAEMVKETAVTNITIGGSTYYCVGLHHLDNLVKEFTEGE